MTITKFGRQKCAYLPHGNIPFTGLAVAVALWAGASGIAHADGAIGFAKSENLAPPATKLVSAPLVSPTAGWTYFGAATTHTVGVSVAGTPSPEIKALTASVVGKRVLTVAADKAAFIQNAFDYVRNNINTEFRYGLGKGGRGALIDQSGTPYDQAELMVMILRQAGVSANYVVGEVTVTPAQFGAWTGLAKTLDDNTQAVTVDAKAACQLLADGGIPAIVNGTSSCSSLSGNLTNVVMSHIWVQANGTNYDPAFKANMMRNGIDLPAAMGCGTQAASTCGTTVKNAGMSGATSGTVGSIPYVDSYNMASAKTANNALKTSLATFIKTQNIGGQGANASVYDVLGGKKLNAQTIGNSPLSYSVYATWTGSIPNQLRTKLSVKAKTACASFFADEIAARPLIYKQYLQVSNYIQPAYYSLDGKDITTLSYQPAGSCSAADAPYAQISVDHPYAANSGAYADEVVNFKMVDPPADETGFFRPIDWYNLHYEGGVGVTPSPVIPNDGKFADNYPEQSYTTFVPVTILHGFGQAGMSAQKHMSDYVAVQAQSTDVCKIPTPNRVTSRYCHLEEHAVVAETFSSLRTLSDNLVDGVAKTVTTRHHDVGIVYAGRMQGLSFMTLQESVSVAPKSGLASDQQQAFDMHSLILSETEARANAISGAEGISAAQGFFEPLTGAATKRIYDIAPAQMATYLSSIPDLASVTNSDGSKTYGYYCINYLAPDGTVYRAPGCWRKLALQDVANQGYSTLIVQGGLGELFYKGQTERALTMWEYVKGGAAVGDSLEAAVKTAETVDEAALARKFLSVSPSSGELTYKAEPDIVTGSGDFPASLAFTRTFTPTYREQNRFTSTFYYTGQQPAPDSTGNYLTVTSGPDALYHDRLGGGWMHNFQVMKLNSIDLAYSLGSENAFLASDFIANLQIIHDLGQSGDIGSKIGSMLAIYNLNRPLDSLTTPNTSIIRVGSSSTVFHKATDGTWFAPQSPSAKLSGNQYTSPTGDIITFSPYRYEKVQVDYASNLLQGTLSSYTDIKLYKADTWAFPNGITLTFHYTGLTLSDGPPCIPGTPTFSYAGQYGYLLSSVSNNLGHSLNFTYEKQSWRQFADLGCGPSYQETYVYNTYAPGGVPYWSYALTSVSDETGRSVSFDNGASFTGSYFEATDVRGKVTRYEYTAGSGTNSPNPAEIVRDNFQLRRWFTPGSALAYQTINYDDMFRVSTVTDRNAHAQAWYPSGMFGSELWKRTELVDGEGNVSLTLFDDKNGDFYSKTPMGRITTKTFDNLAHPLRTVMPEGNAVEQTYDIRGNVLRVCKISKARAGLPCDEASTDIVTKTTYMEGPTVIGCVNSAICNKPASETDALGKSTNYTWDATSGNLTQILLPADRTGVRPQTDVAYTSCLGASLLSSKTDKISSSQTVVTTYSNDSSNHCALQQVVTDSGGANLTTALTFDAIGNLTAVNGPLSGTADTTTYQWETDRLIKAVISADPDAAGVMLRKETKYTYNDDRWVIQTDTGTATGADGTGFTVVTSEKPTFDLMGNKVQSKLVKP